MTARMGANDDAYEFGPSSARPKGCCWSPSTARAVQGVAGRRRPGDPATIGPYIRSKATPSQGIGPHGGTVAIGDGFEPEVRMRRASAADRRPSSWRETAITDRTEMANQP